MKKLIAVLAVVAAQVGIPSTSAVAITGQLVMDGTANLNNALLGSASAVSSFGSDVVATDASDGVFTDAAWTSVTINGFNFDSSFSTVDPLWTVTSGGEDFSFKLTGLTVIEHSTTYLDILGTGVISSTALDGSGNLKYENTAGTFSFTISDSDGVADSGATFKFGFSATSSASSVPDGGASIALLGVGIVGLAALRRRS